jgi:predicted O-linked N-acetylglucosamine transferase (SPINDLY family)
MNRESINELFSKAHSFRTAGDLEKAISILHEIVRRDPSNAEALSNIGLLLYEKNNYDSAIEAYQASIRINPNLAEVQCNLGTALLSKGALNEAANAFNAALNLKKDFLVALIGLGSVKQASGDFESARRYYVEALHNRPDDAVAHFRLGMIMREWDRLDMAAICFRNAIRFKPDFGQAYMGLGETLQASGLIEESEVCFRKTIELDPGNNLAWSNLLLSMNYNPAYNPAQLLEAHKRWGDGLIAQSENCPSLSVQLKSDPDRILRIGYVSADFCQHPAASFLEPVLRNHDPTGFKIYCYSQGSKTDSITAVFKTLADEWRDIRTRSDEQVRQNIVQDRIDIIVDCTGHMADNRLPLFSKRCAPIHISWMGYPNTTGLSTMDFRFGDEITDPVTSDPLYVEKLIRLPQSFCCYEPPEDAPEGSELPALKSGHITFGSLHTLARLNHTVIARWSGVLRSLPSSRLVIFRTVLNETIENSLSDQFAAHGIDRSRIDFVRRIPEDGHLGIYKRIDIALDTTPWSGHTTACEALWMGVPVITLAGDRHAGRMVASVLMQLGLDDFIAENEEEYSAIAEKTSRELPSLAMLRNGLRSLMETSPLCDGKSFTRNLEYEYRKMMLKYAC